MTAFNVVRFRVKPGREEDFLEAHRQADAAMPGLKSAVLVKTGDRSYCFVGEWEAMSWIVAARPQMIGMLDRFRDALEELGADLGVTDPVSGDVVVQLNSGARRGGGGSKRKAKAKNPARGKTGSRRKAPKKAVMRASAGKRRR
jgi:hypothetical protein